MRIQLDTPTSFLVHDPDRRPSTYAALKRLGGRQRGSNWTFPRSMLSLDLLRLRFPALELTPEVQELAEYEWGFRDLYIEDDDRPGAADHQKWTDLYPFQKDAVAYLLATPHKGALLSLSPGLGKTAVALIAAELLAPERTLSIAPLSLLYTWKRQASLWRTDGVEPEVCWGRSPSDDSTVIVTNYETVAGTQLVTLPNGTQKRMSAVKNSYDTYWDLLIIDESIFIKNRKSQRSQSLERLAKHAKRVWCLSGSPISKYADDLYQQLRTIEPHTFTSYWRFAELTCEIEESVWGTTVVGTRDDVDVAYLLRDFMFVRNQKDVLDLPPLRPETIYVPMFKEQEDIYNDILTKFEAELADGTRLDVPTRMAQLVRLQQVASNPINIDGPNASAKTAALLDLIAAGEVTPPTIIWVHWTEGAVALLAELTHRKYRANLVIGGMPDADKRIQSYLDGDTDYLILSLNVGKYGHTLTNTNTVVYYDKNFDADSLIQSLYRVQRIGLDHPVPVISLVAQGTVDEIEIVDNLGGKMVDIAQITNADLATLLKAVGRVK